MKLIDWMPMEAFRSKIVSIPDESRSARMRVMNSDSLWLGACSAVRALVHTWVRIDGESAGESMWRMPPSTVKPGRESYMPRRRTRTE